MRKEKRGQEVFAITPKDLNKLRKYFKTKPIILSITDFGCNVALRGVDLINLKFEDIRENIIRIQEKKTLKYREILLNKVCLKAIKRPEEFYEKKGVERKGYIFKSLHPSYVKKKIDRPITLGAVDRYYRKACMDLQISYPIGTHSLRKTWGNRVYKKTKNIAIIMIALNHSNASHTLRYIGITQDEINSIYNQFEI